MEIKFRAWSKNVKQMFEVVKINWVSCTVWFKDASYIGNLGKHDIILLQYTGLRDRGGKEIYEGNIVEWDGGEPFGKGGERAIIKRANGGFELTFYTKYGGEGYGLLNDKTQKHWEKIKVIGNIYMHPELLGEVK